MDFDSVKLFAHEVFGEELDVCIETTPGSFQIGFKSISKVLDATMLDVEKLTDFRSLTGLTVKVGIFASIDLERFKPYGRLMLVATKETGK